MDTSEGDKGYKKEAKKIVLIEAAPRIFSTGVPKSSREDWSILTWRLEKFHVRIYLLLRPELCLPASFRFQHGMDTLTRV